MAMTLEQVRDSLLAVYERDRNGTAGDKYRSDWAKQLADDIDAHLSAQAKVRGTSCGLSRELRLVCGHDSRSVDGCLHCEAADALEARDVGPASNEATVSDAELLEAAREVGLRAYLHGVGPTDAEAILRSFVDKVAARLSHGAQVSGNSGELAGAPQGAQGEAVGEIDCLVACRRLQTLVEEYEHGETGETFGDKEWLVHDFIAGSDVWSIFESLYAHPAKRAVVPDGWVLTADRLPEVPEGSDAYFWIAVKRANGKIYTWPAIYANRYPLCCAYDEPREAAGPGWSQVVLDENDEGDIAATGWYDIKSDDEYDYKFVPVCEKGDEVIAWQIGPKFERSGCQENAAPQPPEGARVVPGVRERNGDAYLVDSAHNDPDHAASPLFDATKKVIPLVSGEPRWFVLRCPGWPGGIDFPSMEKALDHIRQYGDNETRLAMWYEQANRVDYTAPETRSLLAAPTLAGKEG